MMNRSSQHKEKLVIRSEVHREDDNKGTAARTRPISYDEIMLRRKNKKISAELVAKPVDAGNLSGEASEEDFPSRFQSSRGNPNTKLSSAIVAKRSSEDAVKVNSRYYEDNMGKDKMLRNVRKDSFNHVIRSKPIARDFSDREKRSMDDRRDQWSRRHENWSNINIGNEYERRHPRHLIERERYADRSRGRPIKDFDRIPRYDDPRYDDEERKSERKIKRKHRNENEERITQQNLKKHESGEHRDQEAPIRKDLDQKERKDSSKIHDDRSRSKKKRSISREPDKDRGRRSAPSEQNDVNKHDSGKRHDQEAPVKKDHESKEPSQYHDEESKSKKKRSRSREREMDKGRRSTSLSPRSHRRTEHINGSSHTSKDRFRREQANNERNEKSNNGSSDRYRRTDGSSSGLGGYSPRKRKTEVGVKTPSPPHRSAEKKSAGWDLPSSGANNNSTTSILPNVQSLSHTVTSNTNVLPSVPVIPTSLNVIRGIFSYASVDSVQLTQATRPMRRLYVENLPTSASEKSLTECFNSFLLSSGINRVPGSQPCISCTINKEKGQALVEFLTPEDASAALYFDGRSLSGSALKIRRPKDYADVATSAADKSVASFDISSNFVRDSPNKIFVGGIPKVISSEMLREIVAVFGPLKAFHFEVNGNLGDSCAFFEYADQSVTLKACAGLNAMRLGRQMLTVLQATPNSSSVENFVNPPFYGIPEHAKSLLQKATQVLKLKNVLNPDDMSSLSEQDLEEILEDVRLECARFGIVNTINVVKHRVGVSLPDTCQAPDGTDSADDKGAYFVEKMKSEHTGEENGNPSETAMLKVPRDVDLNTETSHVPGGTVSADNIATDSIKNLKVENCEEQIDGNSTETNMLEPPHDNNNNVTSLDNSEMIVTKLENNNPSFSSSEFDHQPSDQNGAKIDGNGITDAEIKIKPMVEDILKTEQVSFEAVSKSSQAEKVENKESVSKIEDIFELGSILVEYKRTEASAVAAHSLHGRLFDNRIVSVEFVDLDIYKTSFSK